MSCNVLGILATVRYSPVQLTFGRTVVTQRVFQQIITQAFCYSLYHANSSCITTGVKCVLQCVWGHCEKRIILIWTFLEAEIFPKNVSGVVKKVKPQCIQLYHLL